MARQYRSRQSGSGRVTVVYNKFPQIARRIPEAAKEVVTDTLAQIDAYVKTGMQGAHSGRIYGSHQASAPGEMPAIDIANLIGSLISFIEPRSAKGYYYTEADYAPHLEYGTTEMLPRPFMTPAAEAAREDFIRAMRDLERRL